MMETTMKSIVYGRLVPFLKEHFNKIYAERENLVIDGVKAYNDKAEFVGGKVINACSFIVANEEKNSEDYESLLVKLKEIIDFESTLPMETWGMLNCLSGLYRLRLNGILKKVLSEETLERLKKEVDWRKFVDINNNLTLINKPTNYYGVAFGIAKYRELMGWEQDKYSELLLDKLMTHIDLYSGDLSYMDETQGEGRFDRYSILIPGEIAALLTATEMKIPEKLLKMLKKSAEIFLALSNDKGNGFTYGRSIGAYGDTAALEVLSIAAYLNLLTEEEKELAYSYNTTIVNKFVNFWIDKEMNSLNMWDKGRRTDDYRNKNRILGENLSLSMQIINSYEYWRKTGFEEKGIMPDFKQRLEALPTFSLFRFVLGKYDRAMAVVRDREYVFSLPLISGGRPYYNKTPYLPIPNESLVLESGANTVHPNLVPKIILNDGTEVMPIVYMKDIIELKNKDSYSVKYHQEELCIIGGDRPQKKMGIKSETCYRFEQGCITREDTLFADKNITAKEISMEFGTFSEVKAVSGNKVTFDECNDIYEIEAKGFDECTVQLVTGDQSYHTSHGALRYKVFWRKGNIASNEPVKLGWRIKYR